jgi:DNA-binding beta-propeller fold protein YncE
VTSIKATDSAGKRSKAPVTRLGLACIALAACTASADEVSPPRDQFFFPTGLAIAPDESKLFVANANSELRFDSGSVNVIDLGIVDQVIKDWTEAQAAGNCAPDPDHRETLVCDQPQFMILDAGARIGNFATSLGVQDTGNGTLRLFIPTRGDPSISWIDYDGAKLQCNSHGMDFDLCDDEHRLSYVHNDPDLAFLPEEPFDVYVDSPGQFAVVTHLTSGDVTLVNSPMTGNATIADIEVGLFAPDQFTGLAGSSGVAARPSPDGDIVYVGARSEDRIQTFTVGHPVNGADAFLLQGNYFFLDAVGANAGSSEDTRGMTFSADGNRMYLLNREPPTLQVYDTSLKDTGYPADVGIGATDICRQASTLTTLDAGDGERVYITCFSDGQLYVVDPRGQSSVEDIITVGRGPYAVKASATRKKIYVTNFLENTIAVIDVAPGSKTYNRVVLRIKVHEDK